MSDSDLEGPKNDPWPEAQSDEALMRDVQNGDLERLGDLFERYHSEMRSFLTRFIGAPALAEDALQETFLRVLKHRHTYRPANRFRPWLYRIARNVCSDLHRQRVPTPAGPSGAIAELPDPSDSPLEGTIRASEKERLHAALSALSPAHREVLLLARMQDLPYREISEILGISVANVKVRVFRALAALRRVMTHQPGMP